MTCAFVDPTRHGTHLPQDSSRKNRSTLVAAASRSVPSAMTTIAPEPSMDPAACSVPKSSSTSSWSGPMKLEDAPPGWMAPSGLPPDTPPARSSSSRAVVPIGTQYTPGRSTWPETAKNFSPACSSPFRPPAPSTRPRRAVAMTGTCANVSTEFISVGWPCRP